MPFVLGWALALLNLVGAQDASCPCLDDFLGADPVVNGLIPVTLAGETHQLPATYGLSNCSAHDTGLPPYCSLSEPPAWCADSWCYVNPEACGVASSDLP